MSFDIMLKDVMGMCCATLSFQDLNKLAKLGKTGRIWANAGFDFFAKALLCSGQTMEDRKSELAKLYREVSPFFIGSINDDIEKIRCRTFENENITIEYGEESYTPFFLVNFASFMLYQVSGIENSVLITTEESRIRMKMISFYWPPNARHRIAEVTGINIRQTPSNNDSNVVSTKLVDGLKLASELFFIKLYEICKIPDFDDDTLPKKEVLQKYKNKDALVIYEEDKNKIMLCHCVIERLLYASGLLDKVDFINFNSFLGVYGEREDVQKFRAILYAQQFPKKPPSLATLRLARGIANELQ